MKTVWAEMRASEGLQSNAGDQLQSIVLDSLGHELGKQALAWADVTSREVFTDGEIARQYLAKLNALTDADLAATVKLWAAARAVAQFWEGDSEAPFYGIPRDLIEKLKEALSG